MSRTNKVIGGMLTALVASIWSAAWYNTLDDRRRLEASVEGRTIATAEVTSCRDQVVYLERDGKNGRTTYSQEQAYYSYRFEVDGRPYSGDGTLKNASCPEPLGTVEVYYLPGASRESLMVDIHRGELRALYFSMTCMVILSLGMLIVAILLWWPNGSSKPPAAT